MVARGHQPAILPCTIKHHPYMLALGANINIYWAVIMIDECKGVPVAVVSWW